MALPSTRYEFRVALSNVDAGVERDEPIIAARHPSETAEHLVLRVLAACLLADRRVSMGPGLSDGEASDLEAHDDTGRLSCWVECGTVDPQKLRRIVSGHSGAEVHVVLGDPRRRRELDEGIAALPHGIKDAHRVTLWQVDQALVGALARSEARRQRWTVTIVGGHLYVEADGLALDGEATATALR